MSNRNSPGLASMQKSSPTMAPRHNEDQLPPISLSNEGLEEFRDVILEEDATRDEQLLAWLHKVRFRRWFRSVTYRVVISRSSRKMAKEKHTIDTLDLIQRQDG